MLLAIDCGNSNIVLAIFAGEKMVEHWRLATDDKKSCDEYSLLFRQLFQLKSRYQKTDIDGVAIASVVPALTDVLAKAAQDVFGIVPFIVGDNCHDQLVIKIDRPEELGADRIIDAIAGLEKYGAPLIVVDFGTAITFDCLSREGDYLGGAIAPGMGISADALFAKAAKLPRVDLTAPPCVMATNTIHGMQSGIIFGFAGLVDGIVSQLKENLGEDTKVVATGGMAKLIMGHAETLDILDEDLTMDGLRFVYERKNTGKKHENR